MRGNGEGKKGEWPRDINMEINGKEGGKREYSVGARGIMKEREREKGEV